MTFQPGANSQQIDETVWQAWLQKNEAQDRFRYEKRLKTLVLVAVLLTVATLLWKFVG